MLFILNILKNGLCQNNELYAFHSILLRNLIVVLMSLLELWLNLLARNLVKIIKFKGLMYVPQLEILSFCLLAYYSANVYSYWFHNFTVTFMFMLILLHVIFISLNLFLFDSIHINVGCVKYLRLQLSLFIAVYY